MPAFINNFFEWYQASGLQGTTITIPLLELIVILTILTVCLLFQFSRTGLIVAYLFIYRWSWAFCAHNDLLDEKSRNIFLTGYIVFGILVLTLTIVAMMNKNSSSSSE
ncbi:hypothetical protein ACFLQL_03830 [Verrucomicrobiota bacterium]